ncbi:MAG: hypothetical protein KIT84_43075 [Labilithrix sp.]|nr:hypothetical protein [Labilithrix sp.]MCW5817863.1 hypothetical protein [Labilithrix sp.]
MIERCDVCGAARDACSCVGLELDLDRRAPPARPVPVPVHPPPPPRPPTPPLPPPPSAGVSSFAVRVAIGVVLVAVAIGLGVMKLRSAVESAVDEAATRPYQAPNRLVIASVTSDYASEVLDDGAILLRRMPTGSAAGLAGWYRAASAPPPSLVDDVVASMQAAPTYRPLAAPSEPCRTDAEEGSARATLGELSFGDDRDVTLWTCTLTKRGHAYFLAWAALSADVSSDRSRLVWMLKGSQLVSDDLCSVNVINGGCNPSAANLVTALVTHVRR